MATQESLDRVQQLYVAYYGRPADQEGQEYWADRLDAEGEGAIINAFGNSEEYAAKAEGQGNATLINAIYLQAFSRGADPEGLAYYAGVLERGEKTLAEIATTIINAAGGIDARVFNARVEAAAAYTAEFGAAASYDIDAAKAAIADAQVGIDATELTAALTALTEAQTAESDFLEALAENEQFTNLIDELGLTELDADADTFLQDVRNAISNEFNEADEDGAYELTAGAVNDAMLAIDPALVDGSFAARSAVVQDELIADAAAAGQKAVTAAEKEAETGVLSAISTVQQRATALEGRLDTEAAAKKAIVVEAAGFAAANADVTGVTVPDAPLTAGTSVIAIAGPGINLTFQGNGTWQVAAADAAAVAELEGFDALLADADAWGVATLRTETARDSLQAAVDNALNLQNDTTTEGQGLINEGTNDDGSASVDVAFETVAGPPVAADDTGALNTILAARDNLSELQSAAKSFEFIRDIFTDAEALAKDITDAVEAIEDADTGLGVDVWTAADVTAGTPDTIDVNSAEDIADDVIVFSSELSEVEVANFGAVGEDSIFFGGDYSLVQLGSTEGQQFVGGDFSTDVGNSAALEVFWTQSGADVQLFVENKAFAGNSEGGADLTQITLAGVNSDDLGFSNGYLTAGEPA